MNEEPHVGPQGSAPIREAGNEPVLSTLRIRPDNFRQPRTAVHLSLSQLQKLADDFDLGRIVQMDIPTSTQCNTTEPFKTGRGTFLLRARHGEEYVERLTFLHEMIDALVAGGFPCPPVVRANSGKSWTVWGERLVEVHRFIPHDPGAHRDMSRMLAAASVLGDLHRALSAAKHHRQVVPPEMRNDLSPKQAWVLLQNLTAKVELVKESLPMAQEAVEAAHCIAASLAPLLKDYERVTGSLPWMLVHGDYHFWNILYKSDTIVSVVDFDFIQERERLFDVAYAMQSLISYLSYTNLRKITDFAQLNWESARLWVDLYDASAPLPLTETERQRLPAEIMRIYFVNLITTATQTDPVETLFRARPDIQLYRWVGATPDLFLR